MLFFNISHISKFQIFFNLQMEILNRSYEITVLLTYFLALVPNLLLLSSKFMLFALVCDAEAVPCKHFLFTRWLDTRLCQ